MSQIIYRASGEMSIGDGKTLEGLAYRFNHPSNVTDNGKDFYLESFTERSAEKTLRERAAVPIPLGVLHPWMDEDADTDIPPVGFVRFRATDEGLAFTARLSDDEVIGKLRAGELEDVSIGFVPYKSQTINGVVVRQEIALYELSLAPAGQGQHEFAKVLSLRATTHKASRLRLAKLRSELNLWIPEI